MSIEDKVEYRYPAEYPPQKKKTLMDHFKDYPSFTEIDWQKANSCARKVAEKSSDMAEYVF